MKIYHNAQQYCMASILHEYDISNAPLFASWLTTDFPSSTPRRLRRKKQTENQD